MDVGPPELLIILVIALVLFGGKKIPQLAKSLGQAKSEFEKGSRGEVDPPEADAPAPAAPQEAEPEPRELVAEVNPDAATPVAPAAADPTVVTEVDSKT
ncbi:twin-arginine translocase TatA/TatE family subunit [Aquihabitans sp. McL0605]|uniref:twin-arginine translocase TatA/TatE family subunit n=1 Tax=Aquihabitans sp. McL0605 TaxID=3415671 RepID=UPI003CF1E80C